MILRMVLSSFAEKPLFLAKATGWIQNLQIIPYR